MFCNKCGKPIESDDGYCSDCAPKEESVNTDLTDIPEVETESASELDVEVETDAEATDELEEQQEPSKKKVRVVDSLSCAVMCVVLGITSYFFTYVGYMLITAEGYLGAFIGETTIATTIIGIALIIIAIGIAIPSLILGVHSIRLYISTASKDETKSANTLELGIYGTVMMILELIMVVTIVIMLVASILNRI